MGEEKAASPAAAVAAPASSDNIEALSWQIRLSHFFALIVLLRLPCFEVPCGHGTCEGPLEVFAVEVLSQGAHENQLAVQTLRALFYPGALMLQFNEAVAGGPFSLPKWNKVLSKVEEASAGFVQSRPRDFSDFLGSNYDLMCGTFLMVGGGIMSLFGPTYLGSIGCPLVALHLYRNGLTTYLYLALAFFCSLAWLPLHLLFNPKLAEEADDKAEPPKLKTRGKFKVY